MLNRTLKLAALLSVSTGLLILIASSETSAAGALLKPGEESIFAVPRITVPPRLDGVIDASEWKESVAVSGTVDQGTDLLDARPATFFLAWDAKNLYMACRVYLRGDYKPQNFGGRVAGGADCFDDGLECLFKPMGGNVGAQNHATEFKFNISSLGHGGTYTRLVVGQIMSNWEPKFRSAAQLTAPGSAPEGGKWWELETAFSLADFELTGDNRAGDKWKLMLGINFMPKVGWMQARIPCIGGYFTPDGKSVATLVEKTPIVQMLMDSATTVAADGAAGITIKAYNPADAAAQVKLDLDIAGKIVRNEAIDLPPGGEKVIDVKETLPAEVKTGRIYLKATDGGVVLLGYTAPFEIGRYNDRLKPAPDPNPNEFPFTVNFNPLRSLLEVRADSYFLPEPDATISLRYEVRHKETGKLIASGDITRAIAWVFGEVIPLADVQPGSYEVSGSIILKDGRTFGPRSASFVKMDEARAFSRWWGKDPGNSERVLPPFAPIKALSRDRSDQSDQSDRPDPTFSLWGRKYAFDALGLPVLVKSQGGNVMAAPARIVVTVGGKETAITAGKPTITDQKDWRIRFEGKAEGEGLAFSAVGWLEQDGMVSVDLTYEPKDGKPVKIDALRIEFPVANDVAECLVSVGPGANFAAMTATVLPGDKQGRLWSTFDTGRPGAHMKIGSFYPHVWLGGDRRGFQWWADSDKGWFPDDDVPAHEVVREKVSGVSVQVPGKTEDKAPDTRHLAPDTCVVLRNNIIGSPVGLAGPHTINFTWNASPFKPLPKGWRMIAATDDGTFVQPHRGVRTNPKTGGKYATSTCNWINPEDPDPEKWSRLWHEQKTRGIVEIVKEKQADGTEALKEKILWEPGADQIVRQRRPFDLYGARSGVSLQHMSFQLIGWGHKSMEDSLFKYFGDEWYPNGNDTWNPSYTDYAMYLLDRAFGEGGVVSTYWDLSFPILFPSPLSGLSYQLPDGRWQPGYNTMNCRRFFQRLWAVQDKHGLNPGAVGCHSTQAYIFPAIPWIDAVLDGERDWNIDVSDMDWVDYYPKERMRAMSVPHNWGVGICWMSNFSSGDAKKRIAAKTRHAEYAWLHDSWINPYLDYSHLTRMPQDILDWGLNGADVVYVPYWRNNFVKCADPEILVSLWRIPGEADGRILLGVFNYNRRAAKNVECKLDLAGLGLSEKLLEMRDLSRDFFLGVKEIEGIRSEMGEAAVFDAAAGYLSIKGLGAHRGRFIGVGATSADAQTALAGQLPAWAADAKVVEAARSHGFVRQDTRFFSAGQAPGIDCSDPAIQTAAWQLPDRLMLAVCNSDEKAAKNAEIHLDLAKINLAPKLPWQDFIGLRQLFAEDKAPPPVLDFYGQILTLKAVPPGKGRIVVIRRY